MSGGMATTVGRSERLWGEREGMGKEGKDGGRGEGWGKRGRVEG